MRGVYATMVRGFAPGFDAVFCWWIVVAARLAASALST